MAIRKKARKRIKRVTFMVKPSELSKDTTASVRINSSVKEHLKQEGVSIQKILDEAIDKRLDKIEFEEKITVIKKPKK